MHGQRALDCATPSDSLARMCPDCNGRWRVECRSCDGYGCDKCHDFGSVICATCGGSGQLDENGKPFDPHAADRALEDIAADRMEQFQ
jgi:hypothetical protein